MAKAGRSGLAGEAIPLYSRIALLAQVVDVFHTAGGREAAMAEVRGRPAAGSTRRWWLLRGRFGRRCLLGYSWPHRM